MGKTIEELNNQYELVCDEIVAKFCKKQSLEFDGWVGNDVGGMASFSCEYFFALSDIILDLSLKKPKGFILEWQNKAGSYGEGNGFINYKSYIMGFRFD